MLRWLGCVLVMVSTVVEAKVTPSQCFAIADTIIEGKTMRERGANDREIEAMIRLRWQKDGSWKGPESDGKIREWVRKSREAPYSMASPATVRKLAAYHCPRQTS